MKGGHRNVVETGKNLRQVYLKHSTGVDVFND